MDDTSDDLLEITELVERLEYLVEDYETLLKDVLKIFSATPRENSELEWDMTNERVAALDAIRAKIEVL
jgi:DNA-binding ferritin-like protein